MTSDEAGRPKGLGKIKFRGPCLHQRVVAYHQDEQDKRTGQLLCKECGKIFPDSVRDPML